MSGDLYLVDDPEREKRAVEIFIEHGLTEPFLQRIGLRNQPWWVIRNFQKRRLGENGGDIDLLFGLCHQRDGAFVPGSEYLVGVEAKCFYRTFEEDAFGQPRNFKAAKDSPQKLKSLQGQLTWLLDAGLDRVLFLELIANPPVDTFLGAASLAAESFDKALVELERNVLTSSLAHFRMSIGAVGGGTEQMRGSISSPACLKPGEPNATRNPAMRGKFHQGLEGIFPKLSRTEDVFTGRFPRAYFDSGVDLVDETYRRLGLPIFG